ncbi:MAG TPA: aminoacyl--tRNA ligase-related protein [Candidatus Saccharimonadales bacterium]|nr:aminoacyl--tRNA ligase-related protein [Candidatus Saccharimonadales bacterium]
MRLSQLFTKTSKNAPADETALNAQLLIKAGYIHKEMAGAYGYLPLGLKVLENIKQIVREEMNALGGQELIMTSLQRQELWEITDRWDDEKVDVWFKSHLQNGTPVGFGWSHEEPISDMMKNFISSYRDLPISVYQFQTKLRNELRAKSGIMRGREFVMKDLYSYARSDEEHQRIYDQLTAAYLRIFERVGLGDKTFLTFASGGAFTQFSHEFQTLTEAGEDIIYVDRAKKLAVNKEVYTDEVLAQLGLDKSQLEEVKAAEVGNIFSFGSKKSEQLELYFTAEDGTRQPVILGSYGIGVTRLMGVIAEVFADDKGLVWPEAVAPAQVYLARLGDNDAVVKQADALYEKLTDQGATVLYDDRDARPGQKFADADLLGIPYRVVVSDKTLAAGALELKKRQDDQAEQIIPGELLKKFGRL